MSCSIKMHWRNLQMKIKIVTNPTCTWPAVNVSVTTAPASLSGPGDCTWLTDTHSRLATAHSALTLDTHTDPASSECRALPEANHTQELSNLKH